MVYTDLSQYSKSEVNKFISESQKNMYKIFSLTANALLTEILDDSGSKFGASRHN